MLKFDEKELYRPPKHPCKPPFSLPEKVHYNEEKIRELIDMIFRYEKHLEEVLQNITSDNVVFKETVNEEFNKFIEAVQTEINLFESNAENENKLFETAFEQKFLEKLDEFKTAVEGRLEKHNQAHTEAYNAYTASLDSAMENFGNELNTSNTEFKTTLEQDVENRLDGQDAVLNDAVFYMKTNLNATVLSEMEKITVEQLGYITPEHFGAVGDGVNDDLQAIEDAISYAYENGVSVGLVNKYFISTYILLDKGNIKILGLTKDAEIICDVNSQCAIHIETANELYGKNITIKDVTFRNDTPNYDVTAIQITDGWIIFSNFENLTFHGFAKCVNLSSSITNKPYAHNIKWCSWFTYDCEEIISQSGSTIPWIYGGVVEDIHYEGTHKGEDGSKKYVLNLRGFRNVHCKDWILEGTMEMPDDGSHVWDSLVYVDNSITFENIYLEVVNDSNFFDYSFYFDIKAWVKCSIKNLYPNHMQPIYVGAPTEIDVSLGYPLAKGASLISTNSKGSLCVENLAFGFTYGNPQSLLDNVLSSKCRYKTVQLGEHRIVFNDAKPFYEADFNTMAEKPNYTDDYNYIGFTDSHGTFDIGVETESLEPSTKMLRISPNYYNSFCNKLKVNGIDLNGTSEWKTLVVTYQRSQCDQLIETNDKVVYDTTAFTFDNVYKPAPSGGSDEFYQYTDYVTVVKVFKTTEGTDFTFDYLNDFVNTEAEMMVNSVYRIHDIAIFDGKCFGACKSKQFIEKNRFAE